MSDMVQVRVLRAIPPNMPGDEASFEPEQAACLIKRGVAAPLVEVAAVAEVDDAAKPDAEPSEKAEPARKSVDGPPATTAIRRAPVKK